LPTIALLVFILAGNVEAARHQFACDHDLDHSSNNCAQCAAAHQTPIVAVAEPLSIAAIVVGEAPAMESLPPPRFLCHFSFRPRSPPIAASL